MNHRYVAFFATVLLFATVFSGPLAASANQSADTALVATLQFGPLSEFIAARQLATPQWLDWTSDGCSTPFPSGLGDTGRSFNFRHACWRHDFSYRNVALLERRLGVATGTLWNHDARLRADRQFLADMRLDCAPRGWSQRLNCRAWALTYYAAVRRFGGP